jgi:hypothetical protein
MSNSLTPSPARTSTPDFALLKAKAERMTLAELEWARADANEAARCADSMERAGYRVSKTGGYYRDEAGVYATEVKRRRAASMPAAPLGVER